MSIGSMLAKSFTRGKGMVKSSLFEGGMAVVGTGVDYSMRRQENPEESKSASLMKSIGVNAAWVVAPNIMWAYTGLEMARSAGEWLGDQRMASREASFAASAREGFGGNFQDTQIAATTRMRGLEAIQQSKLNARSAFNNQARNLHRF